MTAPSNVARVAGRQLEPLYDRVLVKRAKPVEETTEGLILPDQAQEKPCEGEVLSCGPGRFNRETLELTPLIIKPGDRVLFGRYSGIEVAFDDEQETQIVMLREDEILARDWAPPPAERKLRVKKLGKGKSPLKREEL